MIEAHCSCVTPLWGENTAGHEQTEKCHLLRGAPADMERMLSSHLKRGRDRVRGRERENKNGPVCQSKYVRRVAADAGAFSVFSSVTGRHSNAQPAYRCSKHGQMLETCSHKWCSRARRGWQSWTTRLDTESQRCEPSIWVSASQPQRH